MKLKFRAHKTRCPICHRVIRQDRPCPLAPHTIFKSGLIVRPIKPHPLADAGKVA